MAKKKIAIQMLKKGQRCREGWTSVELKVGKVVRRACIRGKIVGSPTHTLVRLTALTEGLASLLRF